MSRFVSSHPVLTHQGDDAGRRAGLLQEGVFEELVGRGPLTRLPHQHPVQEAFEDGGDLGGTFIQRSVSRLELPCGFSSVYADDVAVSVPCAGSSVWAAGCLGSSSWL